MLLHPDSKPLKLAAVTHTPQHTQTASCHMMNGLRRCANSSNVKIVRSVFGLPFPGWSWNERYCPSENLPGKSGLSGLSGQGLGQPTFIGCILILRKHGSGPSQDFQAIRIFLTLVRKERHTIKTWKTVSTAQQASGLCKPVLRRKVTLQGRVRCHQKLMVRFKKFLPNDGPGSSKMSVLWNKKRMRVLLQTTKDSCEGDILGTVKGCHVDENRVSGSELAWNAQTLGDRRALRLLGDTRWMIYKCVKCQDVCNSLSEERQTERERERQQGTDREREGGKTERERRKGRKKREQKAEP